MGILDSLFEVEDPQRDVTPSLEEALSQAFRSSQQDLRVCMPAKVIKYDFKKQAATVQPLFKRKYKDGSLISLPQIYNVPVAHPRAGQAWIHLPIKKGDHVLLVFSDRSLEQWLTKGGEVDPAETRMHHIADAIAYPGCYPFSDAAKVANGDDIVIHNGNTTMNIKANNHLQVINGTTELVKTLCEWMRAMREAVTYTCGGPEHLYHPKFADLEKKIKSFLEHE